jgi:WhiB family redox-sensing transcriptional regulator
VTDNWRDEAACRDADPETFFPTVKGDAGGARHFCRRCYAAADCLAVAMRAEGSVPSSMRFGVWAGTTPLQRARMYGATRASRETRQRRTA